MKINLKNDILLSMALHAGLVLSFVLFAVATKKKFDDFTYVEVSFGLNENLVQTRQTEDSKQEGERIALKAKDALPQLTQNSAPKVEEQKADEDVLKKNDPGARPPDAVKPQDAAKGTLDMKDYLKRKEEDLRKTGDVAQTGQKQIDPSKKTGKKHSMEDIPRSPFETVKMQNAPVSAAPTGMESGKVLKTSDAYKIYLRNKLKENWNMPDLSSFPASLAAVVSFTVNEHGALNGAPKIVESSQNGAFDRLVIEAVAATFPVDNPPPEDIHPPQTFLARYNARDIK